MKLRLRDDKPWEAGAKRAIELGASPDPRQQENHSYDPTWLRELDALEPARLGDVWRIMVVPDRPRTYTWRGDHPDWVLAGYGLTCPVETCDAGVHEWTHAYDCPEAKGEGTCKRGDGGQVRSCWEWTGSIENGTLTANPSLQMLAGCEWHGWLRDGEMVPA